MLISAARHQKFLLSIKLRKLGQLTGQEILQWLAEIRLDPDVQKSINRDKFLKVYESLKELESNRGLFR